MLDTLLPQVLGRRADMARFTGARVNVPLGPVDPVASVRTDGFDRPTPGTASDGLRGRGAPADEAVDIVAVHAERRVEAARGDDAEDGESGDLAVTPRSSALSTATPKTEESSLLDRFISILARLTTSSGIDGDSGNINT